MPDRPDSFVETPRILVVDDSSDNRELLVALLEDDYLVETAGDGVEGLAAIAAFQPDLVLLDLMMPNLDGFGVLLALREEPGQAPPVLVISASSERAHRIRALELGAHDFVSKPVDGEELRVRVRNTLEVRRTAALAAANEALRRADRYKDEFLSVMSHELRTPLNFIMGFSSSLEDGIFGDLTPAQLGAVRKVLGGADRMLALVDDLLEIARIASGELRLVPRSAAYGELVDEVLAGLAGAALEKGLRLTSEIEVPAAWPMDTARVVQVLTHLVGNAVKFTSEGEIRVRARVEDGRILTEVVDTGIGIADGDSERIFERFNQADMSRTRQAGGAGLGLALARGLVHAHGGEIGVRSLVGQGSTFWFTLPPLSQGAAVRA